MRFRLLALALALGLGMAAVPALAARKYHPAKQKKVKIHKDQRYRNSRLATVRPQKAPKHR